MNRVVRTLIRKFFKASNQFPEGRNLETGNWSVQTTLTRRHTDCDEPESCKVATQMRETGEQPSAVFFLPIEIHYCPSTCNCQAITAAACQYLPCVTFFFQRVLNTIYEASQEPKPTFEQLKVSKFLAGSLTAGALQLNIH